MTVRKYTELIAWQRAIDFVEAVYTVSGTFPKCEMYGLTAQLRRAAVSVPSNIAEGQSRNSSREFMHHLGIAYGSLSEVETQLVIAGRMQYVRAGQLSELLERAGEVGRLINGLSNSIGRRLAGVN